MSAIFPPVAKGGVPPGPNVCNGYLPHNPVMGEGPLYVAADCTTFLTDCQLNSLASEILAAVDALDFAFNANRIDNLGQALQAKFTAQQTGIDNRVARSGDTMTGPLVLPCPPANDNDAACKRYVDDTLDACCGDVRDHVDNAVAGLQTQLDGKVSRTGDWMSGPLLLSGDPTLPGHAATKHYVDEQLAEAEADAHSNFVRRGGDTLTGPLILNGDPALPLEAATKNYVDVNAAALIIAPSVPSAPAGRMWWNSMTGRLYVHYDDGDSTQWVGITAGTADDGGGVIVGDFLPLGGGTLTGPLILSDAPTAPLEAATKNYVDQQIALGGTFVDAPADGELYVRQDNAWTTITITMDGGTF